MMDFVSGTPGACSLKGQAALALNLPSAAGLSPPKIAQTRDRVSPATESISRIDDTETGGDESRPDILFGFISPGAREALDQILNNAIVRSPRYLGID